MTHIVRAEALLACDADCSPDALAVAKAAGLLAARRTPDLVPYCQASAPAKIDIEIAIAEGEARITVSLEAESGGEAQAQAAAAIAAITLAEMTGASLQSLKLADKPAAKEAAKDTPPPKPFARKTPVARVAQPTVLMGLTGAPSPTGKIDRREAFRTFMTSRHLRATEWAKQAGVPAAIVYAYLTGRTASLDAEVAAKLAGAANVRVEDMFK